MKKSVFKNLLWGKMLEYIQQHPDLQTDEVPASGIVAEAPKAKKLKKWIDDLWETLAIQNPGMGDKEIGAEKFVEEVCIPKFVDGVWPLKLASGEDNEEFKAYGKETLLHNGVCLCCMSPYTQHP